MPYLLIGLGIVALLVIWFVASHNKLVRAVQVKDEAYSAMDICMKKRYDLIPNLVETVKGYAKHENETFENVVRARNQAVGAQSPEQRIEGEKTLESAIRSMMLVVERYPELKADSQFLNLQAQLGTVENDIAESRKYYNGAVRQLNTMIRSIPTNLVASMMGVQQAPYYEVSDAAERQNVKVSF